MNGSYFVYGQKTEDIIDSLRFSFNNSRFFIPNHYHQEPVYLISQLAKTKDSFILNNFSYTEYYELQREYAKKQLGLSLSGDMAQNSSGIFGDDDNVFFQRRYQLGIEWDFLKNGLNERKRSLQNINYDEQLTNIHLANEVPKKSLLSRNACIAFYNKQKIELLTSRLDLLNANMHFYEKLFFNKEIHLQDLYQFQSRIEENEAQKSLYEQYNKSIETHLPKDFYSFSAPMFELNDSLLFQSINRQKTLDTVALHNILNEKITAMHPWYEDVSLRAYTRLNVYDLYDPLGIRSFATVGLHFQMPIPFSFKEKRALETQRYWRDHQFAERRVFENEFEISNHIYEYRYALKQLHVLYQKKRALNELIRIEKAKSSLNEADFNPMLGMKLIDDAYQLDLELLEVQQLLYLKLIDVLEKLPQNDSLLYFVPLDEKKLEAYNGMHRSVYAWSKTFSEKASFLSSFCTFNHFEKVYLAINETDSLRSNKSEFFRIANNERIEVALMLGNNKLLEAQDVKTEINKILENYNDWKIAELHLDIEPHVLESWKSDPENSKAKYLALLASTREICDKNGWKLSVAIPLMYDSTLVKSCMKLVDGIIFMCYENVKDSYLERKLSVYKNYKDLISIALRTEDFKNRIEMEEKIAYLSQSLGFEKVVYHDLGRLIALDRKLLIYEKR